MSSPHSTRRSRHHLSAHVVAASALELQRATIVARLMGLEPTWASSPTAKPAWWLETWARQLAAEHLSPQLGQELLTWLAGVRQALAAREEQVLLGESQPWRAGVPDSLPSLAAARRDTWLDEWLRLAHALEAAGAELERRIVGELAREAASRG